jgi:integrase
MKNIRHDRYGTQAYFKVAGHQHTNRWSVSDVPKLEDRIKKAREWLNTARAYVTLDQPIPESAGPRFETDAQTYLDAVTSMPSYSDRVYHIKQWASVFRGRDRDTISPLEIRTQLEKWRQTLSASSVNKRRTALMSFYTRLNGRSGYNPVRDVAKYPEEEEMRAQHPYTILRVLSFMRPSKTRARLMVILTTGWPHAQLKRLRPEHLRLDQARAYVTPRRKGKGRKGVWLPLLPAAVQALRVFQQWDCFTPLDKETGKPKPFSHSSMHSRFAHALGKLNAHRAKLKLPPLSIHPYDIRHTFGTALAHRMTDERAIQELMLHSRIEQTRRYTEAATQGRVERAVAEMLTSTRSTLNRESGWLGVDQGGENRKRKTA